MSKVFDLYLKFVIPNLLWIFYDFSNFVGHKISTAKMKISKFLPCVCELNHSITYRNMLHVIDTCLVKTKKVLKHIAKINELT